MKNYKKITDEINILGSDIKIYEQVLNSPELYLIDINEEYKEYNNDEKFKLLFGQIEYLQNCITDQLKSDTVKLNLYIRLCSIVKWCNEYISKLDIKIVELD